MDALLLVGVAPVAGGDGSAGIGLLTHFCGCSSFPRPLGYKMTPYNELLRAPVEFPRLCLKGLVPHAFHRAGFFSRMGFFYTRLRKIKGLG